MSSEKLIGYNLMCHSRIFFWGMEQQ